MSPLVFRTWMPEDVPFLWEMLYQSLHVREGSVPWPRSVLRSPAIAHYLTDFGSHDGDDAQVCLDGGGERVGAAWVRRMTAADPGYGYVNDEVPELGMAIQENWRGRGIGRRLLETLLDRHPRMSLSVDEENLGAGGSLPFARFRSSRISRGVDDDGHRHSLTARPCPVTMTRSVARSMK